MSSIGKIFILLNFLLAGVFLGWASTALGKTAELKTNYEAEVAAHVATKSSLETELQDLNTQLSAERTAKEEVRGERDQEKSRADRNKEDLDAQKRSNDQLLADVAKIQSTLDGFNTTISNLESSKDTAVAAAHERELERDAANDERDAAMMAQRDAEEQLAAANAGIVSLEKNLKSKTDEAEQLDAEIETIVAATGFNRDNLAVAKQIDGRVLQVDYKLEPGLVALNVGKNDGVTRGTTFEIYAGQTYKGQVRVENVHDKMCSALIVRPVGGTTISQGDSAATRL